MTADLNALLLTLNGFKPQMLNMKVFLSPKRCEASPHAVARLYMYPHLQAIVQLCSPSFLVIFFNFYFVKTIELLMRRAEPADCGPAPDSSVSLRGRAFQPRQT